MKSAIAKSQNQGGNAPPTQNKKLNEKGPRRFYFDVSKKDPNAMDIDAISMEKWAALMRKVACFICEEPGQLAWDHKKQMEKGNDLPQKMKGKELHAHVRALLAWMDEDDKEEFFADAKKQGFWLGDLDQCQFLLCWTFILYLPPWSIQINYLFWFELRIQKKEALKPLDL